MQYLFEHEEDNVIKLLPYGSSKKKHPHLQLLKHSKTSAKKPKPIFKKFIAPLEIFVLQGPSVSFWGG